MTIWKSMYAARREGGSTAARPSSRSLSIRPQPRPYAKFSEPTFRPECHSQYWSGSDPTSTEISAIWYLRVSRKSCSSFDAGTAFTSTWMPTPPRCRATVSTRVEAHERVGERPRLRHGQVGAAQQGLHLLRLDPADQVGRARKDRADRELRVRSMVSPHDEVIQVGLRRRVRIAVERDGQLIDRAHLEGSGAERSHTAVRAGHDLRRRHALVDVLRDDADPERQREGRFGGPQGEHHLAPPSGGHADLPPSASAPLLR